MHEEMETEGKLQTMCICEEREYLSLSSWMRGERGAGEGEWSRWRGEEVKRMKEERERWMRMITASPGSSCLYSSPVKDF